MKQGMKRRLLFIVPLALVLGLLVVFFALKTYFTEARILSLLQPRLEAALGRPVQVTGARLQAWPLSVSLDGITVQEQASPAGTRPQSALLQLQTLRCRVDPAPLLRRRLLIQSLTLDSLRVRLHQRADSTWNFVNKPAAPATGPLPATGAPESAPLALTIRSLQIRGAVLEIQQVPTQSGGRIPLDADLRFEVNRDMSRVLLEGDVRCSGFQSTHGAWSSLEDVQVRLQPRMHIDVPDSSAQIEALTLQVQDLEMLLDGAVQMRDGQPHGQLRTASKSLQLARVLSLVPTAQVPALETVEATGLVDLDLQVELRGTAPPWVVGSLSLADGQLQMPELPAPLQGIQADVRWQGDRIDIHKVAASFQQEPLQLRGTIVDPLDPARARYELTLEGALSLAVASAFATLPPGTSMQGLVTAQCEARGRVQDPESLQLNGKLQLREAVISTPESRQPLHINGEALLANEEMRFENVQLTVGRSKARLSGRAAPLRAGAVPRLELNGSAALLDLDEILPTPSASTQPGDTGRAGATSNTGKSSSLLPPHPANDIELRLDVVETHFQLARWVGTKVHARAGSAGFQVQATVDSLVRDALRLRGLTLQLEGDSLHAQGSLSAGRSTLGRVQSQQLRSQLQIDRTQVHLQDMTASLYGGKLEGSSVLDLADPQDPKYSMQLDMESVDSGGLLADVLPGGQWMTGKLNGSSTWSSSGAAPNTLRRNLSASGKAQASAGTIYRFPLVDAITNSLRLQDVPTLSYQDLVGQFSVAEGRVHIPELRMIGTDLTAISGGSIDINGQVDLKLNVVLSEEQTKRSLRGDLGKTVQRLFADPQGRLVLDLNVGGTLKSPQLEADLQSTASRSDLRTLGADELQRLLGDLLPQGKEDLGGALRRGLNDLLGKDRKKAAADSSGKP